MKEIWKSVIGVEGYDGLYKISSLGRIQNLSGKILKTYTHRNYGVDWKYRFVTFNLCSNSKRRTQMISRLVALAFIPNPDNKPHVNHIDNNPLNNNALNLEWVTARENKNHSVLSGRHTWPKK